MFKVYASSRIESEFLCDAIDFLEYYLANATTGSVTFDLNIDKADLYTQEQDATGALVQTDASSSTLLSDLLSANSAVMAAGGQVASGTITTTAYFDLVDCD